MTGTLQLSLIELIRIFHLDSSFLMQEARSRKLKQLAPGPLFQQPVTKKMTQQFTQDIFIHITTPRTMAYVSDCIPFFIFNPSFYYIIFTLKIRQMDRNLRKQECPERIFLLVCKLAPEYGGQGGTEERARLLWMGR